MPLSIEVWPKESPMICQTFAQVLARETTGISPTFARGLACESPAISPTFAQVLAWETTGISPTFARVLAWESPGKAPKLHDARKRQTNARTPTAHADWANHATRPPDKPDATFRRRARPRRHRHAPNVGPVSTALARPMPDPCSDSRKTGL